MYFTAYVRSRIEGATSNHFAILKINDEWMLDADEDCTINQISIATPIWIALLFTAYLRVWICYFEAFCKFSR